MDNARVLTTGLRFPEGPVWMADGSVIVVEIEGQTITRVAQNGAKSIVATPGGGPNGLAIGPDGALYCCNNGGFSWHQEGSYKRPTGPAADYAGGRIERIDIATGAVTVLYDRCGDDRLLGCNDIVFDRQGGFYFTDPGKARARDRDLGGVYYAQADGSKIVEVIHPILSPNGIGLSPDDSVLYVAETETGRVWQWDVTEPGVLAKQKFPSPHGGRLLYGLGGFQRCDSLAVDAEGNVCLATLMSGAISVISPDGTLLRQVMTGDVFTTNICFGGPGLRTAYLTLSAGGALVEIDWPVPGLKLAYNA